MHWPELNIRKLGCHHRKEQKSSEKHLALPHQIKFFSFRNGFDHLYLYISELFSSFWSNTTLQIALSTGIYIAAWNEFIQFWNNAVYKWPSVYDISSIPNSQSICTKYILLSNKLRVFVHRVQNLVCFLINMHRSWGPLSA